MEKEIMDKINRATEELRKRNNVIKEKRNAFYSEVLTTEIRKMLLVIIESVVYTKFIYLQNQMIKQFFA